MKTRSGKCTPKKSCVGMEALLDAEVRNGIRLSLSVQVSTGSARNVIVHQAKYEGRKVQMYLSYCPCCGVAINQNKSVRK